MYWIINNHYIFLLKLAFFKKGIKILISVSPVEIFEDEKNIGENKKSITYEMVFQDREKTLEDKDVNPIIDEIIDIAKKNFNAKLRV